MAEGYWLGEDLKDHADYYSAVPQYVEVFDEDDDRVWYGPVHKVVRQCLWFDDEARDTEFQLRFIPSKDANRLNNVEVNRNVASKCRVTLQPLSEVADD